MPTEQHPARRERKKAETRRAIADAALRLFALRGFDAVTVNEVAEAADVSAKTVFNYFPVKEQLFYEHEPLLSADPAEAVRHLPIGREAGAGVSGGRETGTWAPGGRAGAWVTVALSGLLRAEPVGDLAVFGRVYRDSETLRAYGRELFAARERALAESLAESLAGPPKGVAARPPVASPEAPPAGPPAGPPVGSPVEPQAGPPAGLPAGLPVRPAGPPEGLPVESPVRPPERLPARSPAGPPARSAAGPSAGAVAEEAGGLRPRILAAAALGPLRQVWESILLEAADRVPPAEAVARGVRTLEEAYAVLGGAFEGFLHGRGASGSFPPGRGPSEGEGLPQGHGPFEGSPPGHGPDEGPLHGRGAAVYQAPPVLDEQPRAVRGERPSIRRVADLAGVSATTVSHTLNGRRPVAEETRRRVLQAIEELGYRPNVLARGLRTSRSQTIGLIIPDITNPFYPALARGLQDVLGPAGYDQIISNTDGVRRVERAAIEQMIARQVDGLAFAVFHTHAEDLLPVIEAGIPVVRLGGRLVQRGVDLVHSDDEGGAAEATRHLLGRGYRRIAFVCGPAAEGPAAERVAGYRAALADAGVPADRALVTHTEFSRAGGAEGVARLLELPEPPDAVLCANDVMAIGALDVAAQRGLRVPGDLAVMGFDDIEAAGMVSPGLTTMANPAREIGQATAVRLLERLRGAIDEPSTELVVPARLVRRQSA
ncbi:substrate-binding domain-containing protein [Nonomuraea sp. NPDC049709]|uniref:substrate-binding domain-containing protein n=1 Tax=Nonomuraea sp. NPDC049709 TaxID=3154736 RepID=UPI0034375F22